jgi:hypothetical protein
MKSLKTILLFYVVVIFAVGCNNQANTNNQEDHTEHAKTDSSSESISLNNGEKWQVNEEMKPFILEAKAILDDYINNDANDYKTLAAQLKEKNSGLIKSCTMDGQSHHELHKWLHPHMDMIETLSKAENADQANATIAQLNKSFDLYHQYFQ